MQTITKPVTSPNTKESHLEYLVLRECPKFYGCAAPLCPLTESHKQQHWWRFEDICERLDMRKHPLVKAQRKIVKHGWDIAGEDSETGISGAELIARETKPKKVLSQKQIDGLALGRIRLQQARDKRKLE